MRIIRILAGKAATKTGLSAAALVLALSWAVVAPGAGPVFWDWPADRPFAEIELQGTALDREGNLVAGLASRTVGPEGPEVFWRIIADGRGGYYTGTGHGGEIHHTSADGENRLVARLEGTEVFSLLLLDDGRLLAGCGPEGQLYQVDSDGEAVQVGSVDGGYVWSMAADPRDGTIWLAAGSPAAVHRYDPAGRTLESAVELPAQNALDLAFDGQGDLLVCTQGPGLIYSLDPRRPDEPRLLFETAQDEARQFITGPEGDLFVLALDTEESQQEGNGVANGSGRAVVPPSLMALMMEGNGSQTPRAALYRREGGELFTTWWTGDVDLMIAGWSERWGWVGGGPLAEESGRTVLYGLTPPAETRPAAGWSGGDILDLLVVPGKGDDASILVCQAHPGSVTILGSRGDEPRHAVSPPLDGGLPVRWGRLNWSTNAGDGKLKWSVRGGNRSEPDESWTGWSDSWTGQNRSLPLEPCRFLQWKVEFPASDGGTPLKLTSVSVSAWQDNRPPVIASFKQEYLKDVHLGMMNNHNENITQTFRSGLQAEFSRNSTADRWAGPERSSLGRSVRVFTWEGSDPNGDRVLYDLEYRRSGERAWRPIQTGKSEFLGSWDTSEVPDGAYYVRLTASDSPDNPGGLAARTDRTLGPVAVDNSPPVIAGFGIAAETDGFRVTLSAEDAGGVLAGARLRLPDGTNERLDPEDGICDSSREKFSAKILWPRPGLPAGDKPWRIRVEVRDMGGNTAFTEGDVP